MRSPFRCTALMGVLAAAFAPALRAQTTPNPAPAAPPAAPAPAPPQTAGQDGFQLRSADGDFVLRLRGAVQYDGRFFPEDEDERTIDQFQLRRIRSDLQGTLYRDYDFRVNLDYAGSRVDVLDAYLNLRVTPALQLRGGKMKSPIGLERLQTPFAVAFPERALPTALVPNRDIGAQLHGTLGGTLAEYALAVLDGAPDGGSLDADEGDGKDVAARVFVRPFGKAGPRPLRGLGMGISGSTGQRHGRAAAPSLSSYASGGREVFFRYRGDGTDTNTALADGTVTRVSPQATWYWGPLGVIGEFVRSTHRVRRVEESRELTNEAWQVTATWVLTGEPASYRGVVPARALNRSQGRWGAWEVGFRVNRLEVDPESFPLFADPARSVRQATAAGGVVNWYLNRAVRLLLSYERTRFDAAEGGTDRPDEHALVTRMQVAF